MDFKGTGAENFYLMYLRFLDILLSSSSLHVKAIELLSHCKILFCLQLDYILGKNPTKMSYLVGYGRRYPQQVHHRGASIPVNANSNCSDGFKWLHTRQPNPNVAVGALVGGPSFSDTYMDSRDNISQSEPTTYNSALIVGLISGLITSSSQVESFVKN